MTHVRITWKAFLKILMPGLYPIPMNPKFWYWGPGIDFFFLFKWKPSKSQKSPQAILLCGIGWETLIMPQTWEYDELGWWIRVIHSQWVLKHSVHVVFHDLKANADKFFVSYLKCCCQTASSFPGIILFLFSGDSCRRVYLLHVAT